MVIRRQISSRLRVTFKTIMMRSGYNPIAIISAFNDEAVASVRVAQPPGYAAGSA